MTMWLIFGAIAVLLPLAAALLHRRRSFRNPWLFSIGSYACFAVSLCDQLITIQRRCLSGDFGGIEDTIQAVVMIAVVLSVVVLLLNLWVLALYYVKGKGEA